MLREAGVRNYSISRHDLALFVYFELNAIERTQQYLLNSEVNIVNSEVNQRWGSGWHPL